MTVHPELDDLDPAAVFVRARELMDEHRQAISELGKFRAQIVRDLVAASDAKAAAERLGISLAYVYEIRRG